ncbi:MAG TPA: O-acetyl-ADP-ribose deacetylase [Longimicrobiales bacterium]|nr:O-acetyl-ADP-ribose deacetylase [Longimicrobiales bacterium]
MDETRIGATLLRLARGDITAQEVDAIVNAANSSLMGGGGVDGAIHRKGGPGILEACRRIRSTTYPDGLPVGGAVTTPAGTLPARAVIHTVGPRWSGGGHGEARLLERAYRTALDEARRNGYRSVAFPSISTGAYGYPVERAAGVALQTVSDYLREHAGAFDEVRFVLYSTDDLATYEAELETVAP